jgi:UDP-N-acetylmuramate dehydrogenase
MNAGAYGGEMKDIVIETEFLDDEGNISTRTDHKFGSRSSG